MELESQLQIPQMAHAVTIAVALPRASDDGQRRGGQASSRPVSRLGRGGWRRIPLKNRVARDFRQLLSGMARLDGDDP